MSIPVNEGCLLPPGLGRPLRRRLRAARLRDHRARARREILRDSPRLPEIARDEPVCETIARVLHGARPPPADHMAASMSPQSCWRHMASRRDRAERQYRTPQATVPSRAAARAGVSLAVSYAHLQVPPVPYPPRYPNPSPTPTVPEPSSSPTGRREPGRRVGLRAARSAPSLGAPWLPQVPHGRVPADGSFAAMQIAANNRLDA